MGERSDLPLPTSAYTLHVVMVGTQHPGNLGAVCRSLLNHGFDSLRLVLPVCHPDDIEARNRAKHAGKILDSCQIYDSFEEAVQDCSLVVGTSGKREIGDKTQKRHFIYPWEFSDRIYDVDQSIALVFGEEGKGLSIDDLLRCDYLVTLPTWEGYPITNLSHAVHTLTYELHRHRVLKRQGDEKALPDIVPIQRGISPEQRNVLRKSIEDIAKFLPGGDERRISFTHSLTRALQRSGLEPDQTNRLIGGFVDASTALEYATTKKEWQSSRRRRVILEEE
ncbi:MAG TPA: RNA methyltransferase [Candidatus Poseidoniaceae archaeon]|nr:RNA methyltransferase [Candidatus Poseidoniaceae archaeon]HII56421.1 RNA methyltransferase [Candidatus Poseidoniaceae archaeon]